MKHARIAAKEVSITDFAIALSGIIDGAKVLTMEGYQPIADLSVGDRIITRRGVRVLRAITRETRALRPIRIGESTLGFSRPKAELLVAPGQEVNVRDWRAQAMFGQDSVVVPVDRLVDGTYIRQELELADYLTFELHFDAPEIINVDGVELVAPQPADDFVQSEMRQIA